MQQLQEVNEEKHEMPTLRPSKKRLTSNDNDEQQEKNVKKIKMNDDQERLGSRLTDAQVISRKSAESPVSLQSNPVDDIDDKNNIPVKLEQKDNQVILAHSNYDCSPISISDNVQDRPATIMNAERQVIPTTKSDYIETKLAANDVTSYADFIIFNSPPSPAEPTKNDDDDDETPSLLDLNDGHIVKLEPRISPTEVSDHRRRQQQQHIPRQRRGPHNIKDQLVARTDTNRISSNNKMHTTIINHNSTYSDLKTELLTSADLSSRLTDIAPPSPPLEEDDQSEPSPTRQRFQKQQQIANVINNHPTNAKMDSLMSLINVIRNGTYEEFLSILHGKQLNKYLLNLFVDGQTALHYSLICGRNLAWCKELVSCGSNPDLMNQDGWHPIHLAAYSGLHETMLYLIDLYDDH